MTITSTSLTIVVSASTPKSLFYFCASHSNMGNSISVNEIPIVLDGNTGNITATGNISGSATSTGSFGAGYIDNKLLEQHRLLQSISMWSVICEHKVIIII